MTKVIWLLKLKFIGLRVYGVKRLWSYGMKGLWGYRIKGLRVIRLLGLIYRVQPAN